MYTRKFWNVLIVDDQEDVHHVTQLALKRESFFGADLKFHHAHSAAEARALFERQKGTWWDLAVAFIDVVMEDDHAGLDLCNYIRNEVGNQTAQIVLRTGQPGKAPARQVIDDYNISMYITKEEANSERLYVVVKTALQQFFTMDTVVGSAWRMNMLRNLGDSPDQIAEFATRYHRSTKIGEGLTLNAAYDLGDYYIGSGCFADKAEYEKTKRHILSRASAKLLRSQFEAPNPSSRYTLLRRSAVIDNHLVVQTRLLGSDDFVYLVIREPTCPRELHDFYGFLLSEELAFLAEILVGKRRR
ncbi:response regulator [Myxococcota bacterium]